MILIEPPHSPIREDWNSDNESFSLEIDGPPTSSVLYPYDENIDGDQDDQISLENVILESSDSSFDNMRAGTIT